MFQMVNFFLLLLFRNTVLSCLPVLISVHNNKLRAAMEVVGLLLSDSLNWTVFFSAVLCSRLLVSAASPLGFLVLVPLMQVQFFFDIPLSSISLAEPTFLFLAWISYLFIIFPRFYCSIEEHFTVLFGSKIFENLFLIYT